MTMHINRAGYKVTTKSSSGTETHYATPRVIQTLMHWYYRCEPPEDRTFSVEAEMLVEAGMMKCGPTSDLFPHWELTEAGKAWVLAILAMPPPVKAVRGARTKDKGKRGE